MATVRVGQVDMTSGEIMEGATLAVIFPKRRNAFHGWIAMSQNPLIELAKADLPKESWKVLAVMLGRLDYENWINVTQAEAAREINLKPANFSRGLKPLVELGVILRGPKVGGHATFRLDPHFGWKGSAKNHHEALAKRVKAAGLTVHEGGGA